STYQGALHPVDTVSWFQSRAYCAALTAQQAGNLPAGYEYRLPTEAEWEYACRAGTTTEFHYGPDLYCNQASFSYSLHSNSSCNTPGGTAVVGGYTPNAFGLYDMHGNVWEWCQDWMGAYPSRVVTNPTGPSSGSFRVCRGGGWSDGSDGCRSAYRSRRTPDARYNFVGFRVLRSSVKFIF
ncbi:MAG: formylglycine-generating enzyme family protein, partial [Planctomycetaceae bacterium]|nr:formylglycine-generating enzyme family protein [Planctomycetaceae bacterium]